MAIFKRLQESPFVSPLYLLTLFFYLCNPRQASLYNCNSLQTHHSSQQIYYLTSQLSIGYISDDNPFQGDNNNNRITGLPVAA